MELNGYVDELHHHLISAAEAVGDDARTLAERLVVPLDSATRLVLLDALSTAAAEITAALAPGSVDVRLRGREPEFVVTAPVTPAFAAADQITRAPGEAAAEPAVVTDDVSTTRTTLRLPDQLKAQVEAAATADGVSVNTWLVRAVAGALQTATPARPGTAPASSDGGRITGWAR